VRLTHIGGPTLLIEADGLRILTDPTFDAPGRTYRFGWGTSSKKLTGPSQSAESLLPLDAILLTHEHHDDNLDDAGRTLLPEARQIITTVPGAKRVGGTGLRAGERTTLGGIEITATPCRHGPPLSHPIVGEVIGFALRWDGGSLWISGDTVRYPALEDTARTIDVDVAVMHLGGVQFPVTGPLRYTMTAKDLAALELNARAIVPLHYEGWKHFRDGRAAIERELGNDPRLRWLEIGVPRDDFT